MSPTNGVETFAGLPLGSLPPVNLGFGQLLLLIIWMVITSAPATVAAMRANRQSKANGALAVEVQKTTQATSDALEKVNVSVTSGNEQLESDLQEANRTIQTLSTSVETLEHELHALAVKAAQAAALASAVLPLIPQASMPLTLLTEQQFVDLIAALRR